MLYSDKLPSQARIHNDRPALRMMRLADSSLRSAIIYPADRIIHGRRLREVCYKTDVHWTTWGAYLAYRELIDTLPSCRSRIVPEAALTVRETARLGDMMLWLDRRDRETAIAMEPPPVDVEEIFTTRTFKTGQVDVYETENRALPKLVLFRTSNSTHLLPFLFHHFARVVGVASTTMHYDLLRSEKPDVVISEISERYIAAPHEPRTEDWIRFPHDFDLRSFSEFTGAELPLPRRDRTATVAEDEGTTELEQVARRMCIEDKLPEGQWHLYIGKALRVVAMARG